MEFVITPDELRRALAEIEAAEKNGFMYCETVFVLVSAGRNLNLCRAEYSDLWEKAHPLNGHLDWGRFQAVTRTNKFKNGKLIPIKEKP
jgi:hypothetical protein